MSRAILPVTRFLWIPVICMTTMSPTVIAACDSARTAQQQDSDRDGDGLSDFHEQYKYLTNPNKMDSDGDGISDGDWLERREYQYTVRSVVQVMKPVTMEFLSDDYQDARLLDETRDYAELEVIHYPFNRVITTLEANPNWRADIMDDPALQRWIDPGTTSNWTPDLGDQIRSELMKDGINLDSLNDRQTVEKVTTWLLRRAKFDDGFSTFITAFDDRGRPYIPDELQHAPDRNSQWTVEEQWEREIFAAGMFQHQTRGSCTSSAIYISGCLRAIGIPARTILCIPVVDAGDESEIMMVRRLTQPAVRRTILDALSPLKNSWSSHTYNEVFVGNRWRRLNYDRLGQNIYDANLFGLMTHVATFHDWSDAKMHETIGRRQKLRPADIFGGSNPYSTISLRDQIGQHCTLDLPAAETQQLTVERIYWTDSADLPSEIVENCKRRGRIGLIAEVTGFSSTDTLQDFLSAADLQWSLNRQPDASDEKIDRDASRLSVRFDTGCYWIQNNRLRIYVPMAAPLQKRLTLNKEYVFVPRNQTVDHRWNVVQGLSIRREAPFGQQ